MSLVHINFGSRFHGVVGSYRMMKYAIVLIFVRLLPNDEEKRIMLCHHNLAEDAALKNASASFTDVEANGHPAAPLPFPPATIGRAERVEGRVSIPYTDDEVVEASNIIYERHADMRPPDRAYWVGRKRSACLFGVVKTCTILKYRHNPKVPWEVTKETAVVKIISKQSMRESIKGVDPLHEVAAMQYLSRDGKHSHVMSLLDVLENDDYLLMFLPMCTSGDLFTFVQEAKRFEEPVARYWFKQILEVNRYRVMCRFDIRKIENHSNSTLYSPGACASPENGNLPSRCVLGNSFGERL